MSMNATDEVVRSSATFFATVDLPEPDPPAMPIIKGFNMCLKTTRRVSGTHYAPATIDSHRCIYSRLCHENQIGRFRARVSRRDCVQCFLTRLRHLQSERTHDRSGRQ